MLGKGDQEVSLVGLEKLVHKEETNLDPREKVRLI